LITLWVSKRKDKERKDPSKNGQESSRQQEEIIKKFRIAHPKREVKIINTKDLIKADGNLLTPVDGVKLGNNQQN
jgi:hypothetical protein